jgi:hypothetical protein|tara:strand:+ start:1251 stop:1667 length:417 start_codon:yes stop_codon:yes gene_type:complete
MAITTYDAVDDIISLIKSKWSNLRPPTISKIWDKRTVGFIDDRSDQVILSPKGEDISYFGLGGSAFWHDQMIEMEIRTYQDIDRHNSVVKEIVKIIKDNITGSTYTDLRVIGSFSKNFQYRNMFSYVVTISYRKSDPS